MQAGRTPDNIAVVGQRAGRRAQSKEKKDPALYAVPTALSCRELNKRSNQLGHLLRQKGVKPGCIVGIMMDRSVLQVTAVLAVLKAGVAFFPFDPNYPVERLAFMINDAHLPVILTIGDIHGTGIDFNGLTFCLESDWERRLSVSTGAIDTAANIAPGNHGGEKPLYIMYTSGSTGTPKGVVGLHKGVLNRCN